MAGKDPNDEYTVFDLNIEEGAASGAEATASDTQAAGSADAGDSPRATASVSDEDLLADLGFLDEDQPPAEVPPPEKKKRVAGTSKKKEDPIVENEKSVEEDFNPDVVNAIGTMPLEIAAVLGRKRLTVKELSRLRAGSLLEMEGDSERLVDLVSAGKTIGKGELVMIEGKLGVRIVKYF